MELYVSSYGDKTHQPAIIKLDVSNQLKITEQILINGKCNMCLVKDKIYTSFKNVDNYLLIINKGSREIIKSDYFYSYAYQENNYLYLASFESGVDSLFDLNKKAFIRHVKHDKNDHPRSHYIARFKEHIISVDNGTQEILIYDEMLNIKKTIDFDEINIRLISFDEQFLYLNTELSNELIVLNDQFEIMKRIKLTKKQSFSAGNANNRQYIVVSLRGENQLVLINKKDYSIIDRTTCGKMPRDIKFIQDSLLVSCSDDNKIQRFKIINEKLILIDEINIVKPITFHI